MTNVLLSLLHASTSDMQGHGIVQVCVCDACSSLILVTADADYAAIQAAASQVGDILLHVHRSMLVSCSMS